MTESKDNKDLKREKGKKDKNKDLDKDKKVNPTTQEIAKNLINIINEDDLEVSA